MSRRGFTLIEFQVVMAIIAIMAAILFPVFAKAREKVRWNHLITQVRSGEVIPTPDQQAMMSERTLNSIPLQIRRRWPSRSVAGPPVATASVRVTFSDGTVKELAIEVPPGLTITSVEPVNAPPAEATPPPDGTSVTPSS